VPLTELYTGKIVPEYLGLEFPGEKERVTVGASAWLGNVRTRKSQRKDLAGSGSRDEWFGVQVAAHGTVANLTRLQR
jgi:hypothetical protein